MEDVKEIEVIARAVLTTRDGRIALCRVKDAKWFFLPGGHIELGEGAISALQRELKEEMALDEVKVGSFVGAIENLYSIDGGSKHEVNLVFNVYTQKSSLKAVEDHICIESFKFDDIANLDIRPKTVKDALEQISTQNPHFWSSSQA